MPPEKITLTRAELYEKVWTTPMRTLAKEFGISDVGLAKFCRRNNIPLPGRGHWAKIQFGKKIPREPLTVSKVTELDTIEIWPNEQQQTEKTKPEDKLPAPVIEVRDDREIMHPVVIRLQKSVSRSQRDERGALLAKDGRMIPFKVSQDALSRTLRILDVFLSELDQNKYTLSWPSPYNTPIEIVSDGEKMQFLVAENIERKNHVPTPEDAVLQKRGDSWRIPRWDYRPTGSLKFSLHSPEFSAIHFGWADGKRRKLEACLGEILVACEGMAPAIKRAREDKAEAERRWAEERKREAEAAVRKAEYERRAGAVKKLAGNWHESRLIKDFAQALQQAASASDVPDDLRKELQTMIEWTTRHADYVDPFTDLNWTIGQFKNPPWIFSH